MSKKSHIQLPHLVESLPRIVDVVIAAIGNYIIVNELLGYARRLGISITIDGKTSTELENSNETYDNFAKHPPTNSCMEDPQYGGFSLDIFMSKGNEISTKVKYYLSSRWLTLFVPLIYIFVFLFALPLNIKAIIIFLVKTKVQKPAVVYMLNLALADVFFVCVLPFNIIYRFSGNNWLIGEGMCRFTIAAFYCNMYCSILIMTGMSVDRYLAVVYPLQSLYWRRVSRSWLVCFVIWLISLCSTIPLLVYSQTLYLSSQDKTTCHDVQGEAAVNNFYRYYFATFCILFFFLPFLVIAFCYTVTIRKLRSSKMGNSEKKRQVVILVIIVISAFMLCFGPTNIVFFIQNLTISPDTGDHLYFTYILCTCVCSISCCLDPFLYYFASTKNCINLYRRLCCKKEAEEITQSNSTPITSQVEFRHVGKSN
ncbi:proteinase-activated receptor 1-like [Anomaloglossus baeobatrachus]|uniref:proteinase-activated receptor 1-like n=1 Tax=Anomaloglossus baeobatrachus TaxID=238106 RepID=UPI003F4FFB23